MYLVQCYCVIGICQFEVVFTILATFIILINSISHLLYDSVGCVSCVVTIFITVLKILSTSYFPNPSPQELENLKTSSTFILIHVWIKQKHWVDNATLNSNLITESMHFYVLFLYSLLSHSFLVVVVLTGRTDLYEDCIRSQTW